MKFTASCWARFRPVEGEGDDIRGNFREGADHNQ
jgi:hypothetical protein